MKNRLTRRVRRVGVTDPIAAAGRYDYADAFEVQLPGPDPYTPETWLRAGLAATPGWVDRLVGLLGFRDAPASSDPAAALLAMARGHAVFCRRDFARVAVALRVESSGRDHPVGRAVEEAYEELVGMGVRLIEAGRGSCSIPPGHPAGTLARAFVGAIEGTTIAPAGRAPHDELLAARAAAGALGLDPRAAEAPERREVDP